jgi:hypothetical protein
MLLTAAIMMQRGLYDGWIERGCARQGYLHSNKHWRKAALRYLVTPYFGNPAGNSMHILYTWFSGTSSMSSAIFIRHFQSDVSTNIDSKLDEIRLTRILSG